MLLHERGGDRRLAIWIGPAEATAMVLSLESVEHPRPMPYSLTASLLGAVGTPLREVRITRLTPPVYYATVIVAAPNGPQEVDARPSDAVNLALVAGVPIRADSRLFGEEQTEHYADALSYPPALPSWPPSSVSFSKNSSTSENSPTGSVPPTRRSAWGPIQPTAKLTKCDKQVNFLLSLH
jgi:bifunctional DNase/RNase